MRWKTQEKLSAIANIVAATITMALTGALLGIGIRRIMDWGVPAWKILSIYLASWFLWVAVDELNKKLAARRKSEMAAMRRRMAERTSREEKGERV